MVSRMKFQEFKKLYIARNMDNNKIQTIFKLRRYIYYSRDIQKGYPTIRLHESSSILFLSLDDAESKIKELAVADNRNPRMEVCAYTIVEVPVGYPFDDGECLSHRIYSNDGTLYGDQSYPITKQEHRSVIDYIGRRVNFAGREETEIKHAVGDIVEIFGHQENLFHRENYAELAIVTKVPPTKHQIFRKEAKMGDDYEVILLRDPSEKVLCPSISVLTPRFSIDAELDAKAYTIICDNHLNDVYDSEHVEQENEES